MLYSVATNTIQNLISAKKMKMVNDEKKNVTDIVHAHYKRMSEDFTQM